MEERFIEIGKEMRLTQDQIELIKENPAGLTKEGCEHEFQNWKKSSNRLQANLYEQMLKQCKCFTESGVVDGYRTIYSRDRDGKPTWVAPKKDGGK